jgi:3-hydroxyacyl-CoA dehydrogenase
MNQKTYAIAIFGAGVMGNSIAQAFAEKGLPCGYGRAANRL